ncbi:2-phosphosulfolactate phosphatase [Carboxylicivirga sp. A043]|uniref:2-phosphosulfolactate phosphatase n=1 Tax=Carboxylicivirga litoralis TaxID=2816963 RepID=UPI0021CB0CF3|nr:2-phosphosulfolactate phosphatase [Carboxylicivirga sp. A043]MCU4155034.1 2-phosphosulfolactate phosphatase [Carboxylicivirga sp. A043]
MKIEVIATAQQVTEEQVKNKTVVVIDVLRATSVMVTALSNGAKAVVPVLSPDEAFQIKKSSGCEVLLGGERHAELIEGFDYGNSPLSYTPDVVKGKVVVMTTTNGTLAIHNSLLAKELYIASFLNDKAIVNQLKEKQDIVLVCSGNNGLYTLEDALCAGRIIHLLQQQHSNIRLSDFALSIKALYESHQQNIHNVAAQGYHYNVLRQKGYQQDLDYCFQTNVCDIVPEWSGDRIVG